MQKQTNKTFYNGFDVLVTTTDGGEKTYNFPTLGIAKDFYTTLTRWVNDWHTEVANNFAVYEYVFADDRYSVNTFVEISILIPNVFSVVLVEHKNVNS